MMNSSNDDVKAYSDLITGLRFNTSKQTSEFSHLTNQIYLDHAANGIYMRSLINDYHVKLTGGYLSSNEINQNSESFLHMPLFTNPHSQNQGGLYTEMYINYARRKILKLFNSNQNEYDVVFVMNATHGLKLIAECFDFNDISTNESNFCYLNDNHTSVIGMREIVWRSSPLTSVYCLFENDNQIIDDLNKRPCVLNAKLVNSPYSNLHQSTTSKTSSKSRSLMVFPAQSNFNGRKYNLDVIQNIKENGFNNVNIFNEQNGQNVIGNLKGNEWFVCLDTASYVSTSHLDLSLCKPDFLVASFYKIFGFPTGIGALLIRKTDAVRQALSQKSYFGGGAISMTLIDDCITCLKNCSIRNNGKQEIKNFNFHEFLEDGTISYLQIIGVCLAIDKFEKMTFSRGFILIQEYLNDLSRYCIESLGNLKHFNGNPLIELYRKEIDESLCKNYGPIISFNLKNSVGNYIGFRLVDKISQEHNIHLRTGCFCNIGACQMYMKHLKENRNFLDNFKVHGHECGDHIDLINNLPTGAIRISFGYCSIKQDIEKFIQFLRDFFLESKDEKIFLQARIRNVDDFTLSTDEKLELLKSSNIDKLEKQYFKISHIFIYPIKSCAPMRIETSWELIDQSGFLYDRNWLIVDSNHIPLTQKRFKHLTKLVPCVDLIRKKLKLEYESDSFEIDLETMSQDNNSFITLENAVGYDEGDHVSLWLSKNVFKTNDNLRLIRIINDQSAENSTKSSFVNKAQYLLVNNKSIQKLRKFLDNDQEIDLKNSLEVGQFLAMQFRPNIVIDLISESFVSDKTDDFFDEEYWLKLKILNKSIEFDIVDNCTRCQMININQSHNYNVDGKSISKYSEMLLKQVHKLKSNSKFGIYLSKSLIKSSSKSIFGLDDGFIIDEAKSQLSVGDIGEAYKIKNHF